MKHNIFILLLAMSSLASAQVTYDEEHEGESLLLNTALNPNKSYHYKALDSIVFESGFRYTPANGEKSLFEIDPLMVFPPTAGITGGPHVGDTGVVGAIGGTVDVSALGGAVYSIPIEVLPGKDGMQPALSITYNSQAGNGLLGYGWSLSGLSSITRCGRTIYHDETNTSDAVDYDNDRCMLDGQRLISISNNDTLYGSNGCRYRTEIDNISRIISYGGSGQNPEKFKVWTKDGHIIEYGYTTDSKLVCSGDSIAMWMVNKISDYNGNYMTYHYTTTSNSCRIDHIDYTGCGNVAPMYSVTFGYDDRDDSEYHYLFNQKIVLDVLLEDISVNYCPVNNQPEDVYKYTFTYDTISPTQGRFYSRLLSIGLEQDGVSVNPTKIEWGNWEQYCHNFGPTTHGNIKDICYVGDFNGDGIDDMVSFPYTTQNDDHWVCLYGNGNGTFSPPDTSYYNKIESRDIIRIRPCDLNGDGLCDLLAETQEDHYGWLNNVIFSTVRLYAYITNSNGTRFANPLKIREYDTDTNHFDFIQIGDFWGDGQNKILALLEANGLNGHGIYAILLSYDWENNDYISVFYSFVRRNCSSVLPGDFNGDGRMEILMTDGDSSTTYSVDKIGLHELHASGFPTAWHKCFPGDFNGDGKTDLLTWAENANPHWHVSLSKTDGFFDQWGIASSQQFPNDEPSTSGPSLNVPAYNDFRYSVNVCDMDGDGKSDVIFVFNHEVKTYPSPVIYNTTNNTCSFIANKCIQNNPSNNYMYGQNRLGYNHIGKFKNDSHCSLLLRYDIYTPGQYLLESFDNQHKQNLVKSITDGMDNSVSFNYDYLTNPEFYTMSSGSRFVNINDGVRKQMIPLKALRYMTTENVSGTTDTTFYSYEDLYLHMTGRGILGFKKSTIINKTNGIKTVNTNRYAGHIRSNSAPLPFLVPDSSNTYLVHGYTDIPIKEISNSCILAAGHQILDQPYPVSVQAESVHVINHEINGDTINLEITEYEYDNNNNDYVPKYEYNNIIRIRKGFSSSNSIMQATACPFRVDTDITYHNAIGDTWLVSRVNKSCTSYLFRDLEGWHDIIKNSVQYTYDNSYPYLVKTEQVNPGDSTSSKLTLKTEYDYTFSNGNISSVQKEISAPNDATVQHRTSTLMFGPQYQYRFPTKTTNSMNHVATSTYDPKFGWKLSDTDCNGLTGSYANDFFGVDTKEVSPAGIQTHLAKRWAAGNADAPQNALYYTWTRSSGTYPSMTFYHKTGVPLRHVSYGVDGEVIYVDLEYDSKGNLHRKSLAYEAGGSPAGYVVYSYDGLNRVVLTEYPDGTSDEMDYNGNEISYTHHNANNTSSQTITKKYLPNGWLEETTDSGGNKVKYEYNSDGSLKSSYVDGSDAVVKLGYNSRRVRLGLMVFVAFIFGEF